MNPGDVLRLDSQLCFLIYAASRAVTSAYVPLLAPLGLTYPQYLVMLVLWEEDGASVGRLGERLLLDSGTLTPLVKRLEGAGLVRRERSAEDERVVLVHLTPAGRRLRADAVGIPSALFCRSGLSGSGAGRLADELRRVLRSLAATAPAETHSDGSTSPSPNPKPERRRRRSS